MPRKPIGVWMLLTDGSPWMFCREPTLDEAMRTARTLRGLCPLFPHHPVWLGPVQSSGKLVPAIAARQSPTTAVGTTERV